MDRKQYVEYLDQTEFLDQGENFAVTVTKGHRTTISKVVFYDEISDQVFVGTGEAVRDTGDKDDPELAYYLALGRAYEVLAAKLIKQAEGRIKHNEDVANRKTAPDFHRGGVIGDRYTIHPIGTTEFWEINNIPFTYIVKN